MNIATANSPEEIECCFPIMAELRPHLNKEVFVSQVAFQQKDRYQITYCEDQGEIVAVAGWRRLLNLSSGDHIFVDDLVTVEKYRSKGYGEALLTWLMDEAKRNDLKTVILDSGVQRFLAHKFYFRMGMHISAYHFKINL